MYRKNWPTMAALIVALWLEGCGAKTGLLEDATPPPSTPVETGCAQNASSEKTELAPLDLFLVLDSSGSMNEVTESDTQKWAEVTLALEQFMLDPRSDGMRIALHFFPETKEKSPFCAEPEGCEVGTCEPTRRCQANLSIPCQTAQDCRSAGYEEDTCANLGICDQDARLCLDTSTSFCVNPETGEDLGPCNPLSSCGPVACDAALYAEPDAQAELPGGASLIQTTMLGHIVEGGTPMLPALTGVHRNAKQRFQEGGTRVPVVVLATDGEPNFCSAAASVEGAIDEIARVAKLGAEGGVSTFAVGVFAAEAQQEAQQNLDRIADAGGTGTAFVITPGKQLAGDLLAVLNQIRAQGVQCNYAIPEVDPPAQPDAVSVFLQSGGAQQPLAWVRGNCGPEGGFFFDSDVSGASSPGRVILCPSTCQKHNASQSSQVNVRVNCAGASLTP